MSIEDFFALFKQPGYLTLFIIPLIINILSSYFANSNHEFIIKKSFIDDYLKYMNKKEYNTLKILLNLNTFIWVPFLSIILYSSKILEEEFCGVEVILVYFLPISVITLSILFIMGRAFFCKENIVDKSYKSMILLLFSYSGIIPYIISILKEINESFELGFHLGVLVFGCYLLTILNNNILIYHFRIKNKDLKITILDLNTNRPYKNFSLIESLPIDSSTIKLVDINENKIEITVLNNFKILIEE